MLDGAPVGLVGLKQDRLSLFDLGHGGRHRAGDRLDLRGVDAPLAEEAELLACAQCVLIDEVGVLQFERHVVAGDNAVRKRGGHRLGLRAVQEGVVELGGRTHGARGDRAVVGAHIVHQAKVQHLDVRQLGDLPDLVKGAVRFDERMDGDLPLDPGLRRGGPDVLDHLRKVHGLHRLGDGDVGQPFTRTGDDDVDVLFPVLVGVIVDADPGHVELVEVALLHAYDHFGVGFFRAGGRAVLAVHGDIEDAAHLLLELERLADALLGAGEMLTRGDDGERLFAFEESLVGVSWHGQPACVWRIGSARARYVQYRIGRWPLAIGPPTPRSMKRSQLGKPAVPGGDDFLRQAAGIAKSEGVRLRPERPCRPTTESYPRPSPNRTPPR